MKFKVGDKVRRKVNYVNINCWPYGYKTCIVSKLIDDYNLKIEGDTFGWHSSKFEIIENNNMKTVTETVTINDKQYQLNVEKAKSLGILTESEHRAGNLYKMSGGTRLLLVKVSYEEDQYQFLGLRNGYVPYSDYTFEEPMTLDEVKSCIEHNGYIFDGVAPDIYTL